MCANCGCGMIHDDMGHPENITDKVLTALGESWGMTYEETMKVVYEYLLSGKLDEAKVPATELMFEKASKAWGQTVDEAKAETVKVLKRELNL